MASRQAATVSYYFFALAVITTVGSLIVARGFDLIAVLFLALGVLTRAGRAGHRIARTVTGLAFVGVAVALAGAVASNGEPLRIGLLGRAFTSESPLLMAGVLAVSAMVCFLVPWLALVKEREV